MGVRQSQNQPAGPSPVEVGGPQVSHHRPRALPTPEDYTHHRAPQPSAARPHGQRGPSVDSRGANQDPRGLSLDSRELLQLDLALSRLQQRLASRATADATARDRPQSHQSLRVRPHQTHSAHSNNASLGSAMPFIFVRGLSSECVCDMSPSECVCDMSPSECVCDMSSSEYIILSSECIMIIIILSSECIMILYCPVSVL